MNIAHQITLDASGNIIDKERLTHDQSFCWTLGSSVNQQVIKESLQQCMYGRCLIRLLCWIVETRRQFPCKHILLQKINVNSAYWCYLHRVWGGPHQNQLSMHSHHCSTSGPTAGSPTLRGGQSSPPCVGKTPPKPAFNA